MNYFEKIQNSVWWRKATQCFDRHYDESDGIMLTDHLIAVTENVKELFNQPHNLFLHNMFELSQMLKLNIEKVKEELLIIAMLHDIGKIEDDKSLYVDHPLNGELVLYRHPVASVNAAIDILGNEPSLSNDEKLRIYWTIEQHDISYGLFREYIKKAHVPSFQTWKYINNNISTIPGAGLLYLLLFKLADIHGHANIADVIWFYSTVKENYYNPLGIKLPVPLEKDIR